jgi:hypothetical protein
MTYVLVSRWLVPRGRDDMWDVIQGLLDSEDPMVWWPSVQVAAYDGESMGLRARSGLGYTVTFTLADLVASRPDRLAFASTGDLRGRGAVVLVDAGPDRTELVIDWRVATDRAWMRWTGWLLRPVFVLGHHLVMRQGERHLRRWLGSR